MHRPIGTPHGHASTIAIWVSKTPRELRNTISMHCRPIENWRAIRGSTPTEVHR
jgi:hypothetical protein